MPYTQAQGGAMDIAADTGMVGLAGAAVVVAEASGYSTEVDALLAGLVAALVRIVLPELFHLIRARLILWRERTEKEIDDITESTEDPDDESTE